MSDSELLHLYLCSANTLHAAPGDCSPAYWQLGALGMEVPWGALVSQAVLFGQVIGKLQGEHTDLKQSQAAVKHHLCSFAVDSFLSKRQMLAPVECNYALWIIITHRQYWNCFNV